MSLAGFHPASDARRRSTAQALSAGLCLQLALILGLVALRAIHPAGALADIAMFVTGAGLLWRGLDRLEDDRFGLANVITLLRWTSVALLPGFILAGHPPVPPIGWAIIALGTITLGLDGIDGPIARHLGQATDFGARFDMEVDAAFVAGLALLAWTEGVVPIWIIAGGSLRYLWLGAGRLWPILRRPLGPSRLRRAVCAIQLSLLLAALIPGLVHPWPTLSAGLGLGLLTFSFSRDLLRLLSATGRFDSGTQTP